MRNKNAAREAALSYAASGWPVLRCWSNDEDGCACPKGPSCGSPGKHPFKSSHGVHDATTDLDSISGWKGTYNIAIALGHRGLLALDIDSPKVAAALRATPRLVGGETGIVRTRRGLHVYFLITGGDPPAAPDIFDKETGECIGQIRGIDHYVVAPPSLTVGGKRAYKWLGEMFERWTPRLHTVDDPNEYTIDLLAHAGYAVEISRSIKLRDFEVESEIDEISDLPKKLRRQAALRDIRMMLKGTFAQPDQGARSQDIQRSAAILAYTAASVGFVLEPGELAGIIKALDVRYFDKYTGRTADQADREYMRSAMKVLSLPSAQISEDAEPEIDTDDDDKPSNEPAYVWDEATEQVCHVRQQARGHSYRPIANFKPTIIVTSIIEDPDEEEKETAWRIRAERNGVVAEVALRSTDYGRSRKMAETLTQKLPYGFSIAQGGEDHILPAIKELAPADVPTRRVPAVPGWYVHESGPVYVLPGSAVAIGRAGVEQSFHLHKEDLREEKPGQRGDAMLYPPLLRYGIGVQLPVDEREERRAWRAFGRLFAATKPHIAAAIILQTLAGPLFDSGVSDVPPLVHIVGRTGVLKTSYCLAALSLMGRFSDISAPVTWRSTPLGLSQALHKARHMTLLVDDYKRAHGGRRDMVGLIQQYADGSHMVRHSLSGQPFERPRGLILSNGEDRFRGEASVAARTTTVEVKEGDISPTKLSGCQQEAEGGVLARVGALWLRWLARSGVLGDGVAIRGERDAIHEGLLQAKGIVAGHRRMLRSAASLLAVGSVVSRFVTEECGDKKVRREAKGAIRALRQFFIDTSSERAAEVEALAPLDHLTGFLAEKMSAGEAKWRARVGGADYPSTGVFGAGRVVGWYEDKTVYVSEHLTFAYYQEEMKRRGEEVAHDWTSITQNIREQFGPKAHRKIWTFDVTADENNGGTARVGKWAFAIPLSLVDRKRKKKRRAAGGRG